MAQWWQLLLGLWTVLRASAGDRLLNVCMNSKRHKQEPGPEGELYRECLPWKDNACCTRSTSWQAHHDTPLLFNFSVLHCGLLTPSCHKHFVQAICFHECSPNLGPWIQPVIQPGGRRRAQATLFHLLLGWHPQEVAPTRQEEQRVRAAPLCREDCEEWWEACRSSSTCKSDWLYDWDWSRGTSLCPAHAPCVPFSEYFPTPDDLCEKIWNNTFKASPERRKSGRCLQKWFEPTRDNPNVEVALHFASSAFVPQLPYWLTAFALCLLLRS